MLNLGLSRSEHRQFHNLLRSSHDLFVRVQVTSLEHQYIGDLTTRMIDGQVDVSMDSEVTRSLKMTIQDPQKRVHLSTDSPDEGAMYFDRMIKVVYVVRDPADHSKQFSCPIFHGPVTKVDRSGRYVVVEAQGKEVLSLSNMWRGKTFAKGTEKDVLIRRVMRNIAGENRMSIPNRKAKIPRKISIKRDQSPFGRCKGIALSMGHQLFYDGRGVLRMRRWPTKSVWTFNEGMIQTDPQFGFDLKDTINAVEVVGGKPKGSKKRIRVRVVAGRKHPLSPHRLGRWGTPRYLPEFIEDDSIMNKGEATKVGKRVLKAGLVQSVTASFDALVVPHLEPGDVCRMKTPEFATSFRIRKFSIPLTADGSMAVGYNKRLTRRKIVRARKR